VRHYAGLDVSLEETAICVIDEAGGIVKEARVLSEPEALVGFFQALSLTMERVGLSKLGSGTNVRRWVVDLRGHDHDETHGDLSRRHDLDRASGADQEQAAR
jgi:hypothetical protein